MSACLDAFAATLGVPPAPWIAGTSRVTWHHRAHAGGRGKTVDLRPVATGFVTVQVRLGVFGTSTGNTIGYPSNVGVRPNSSYEKSQPAGDLADPSTNP